MRGHRADDVPFPAEIFHELRRQFDRVPLDALNARHARNVDLRQQMMEPVSEFVEERDDFAVRERRRLTTSRGRQIARHVRDRMLNRGVEPPTVDRVIHPRAALLAGARVQIEIELADQSAIAAAHIEEAHAPVPNRRIRFLNRDTVNRFDHPKQSRQHLVFGEILPDFLFRKRVARRLELLGRVSEIPRRKIGHAEFVSGERRELGVVTFRVRLCASAEITQKPQYFVRRLRHLGHQRHFGKIVIAE